MMENLSSVLPLFLLLYPVNLITEILKIIYKDMFPDGVHSITC
jgi:hypothetical protein